jgi:hypothetical protein
MARTEQDANTEVKVDEPGGSVMSRNKGHGRNEQQKIEGEGGKGTKAPTREHAGQEPKKQAQNMSGHQSKDKQ